MDDKEWIYWQLTQQEKRRRRSRNERKARRRFYFMWFSVVAILCLLIVGLSTVARSATEPRQTPQESVLPAVTANTAVPFNTAAQNACAAQDEELPLTYLGRFGISHYCPCEKCCGEWADGMTATGTVATEGRTVAVDPDVIPYGSRIAVFYDSGEIVEYIAEDCGGVIKGNKLDIFISDHDRANELGIMEACVYIVNE